MSRYTCWYCRADHGTENVEAVCAPCHAALQRELAEAKADIERWKKLAQQCGQWDEKQCCAMKDEVQAELALLKSKIAAHEKTCQL